MGGHAARKIMFVLWSPEGAKVKDKMMTTGSKDALKRALVGIGQDFQATDASEITFEECLEKAKSAVRGLLLSRTCAVHVRLVAQLHCFWLSVREVRGAVEHLKHRRADIVDVVSHALRSCCMKDYRIARRTQM